jgi:hypothetical protein
VIDYGIVNEEAWERIEEFRIGKRVKLDHLEIVLWKRRRGKERRRKRVEDKNKTDNFYFFWNCCFMHRENVVRNRKVHRAK